MNFTKHSNLEGLHAAFGASTSSWLRYSDDKVIDYLKNMQAKERGTRLHAWAKETIDLGIKQPRSKSTLSAYVNDAIGFRMSTEVVLYYSDLFFGTADAIAFNDNVLRIHDLKTGKSGHMEQLYIYAALFCLEYRIRPSDITIECRLYIDNEVVVDQPTAEDIVPIMDRIIYLDKMISAVNEKGGGQK